MRTTLFTVAALAASAFAAPVESELLTKAKALYKRNSPIIQHVKRNNGGSSSPTDADILNFALQLEYLEAQYYHIAAYGTQLDQSLLSGKGTRGYVSRNAGKQVPFKSKVIQQYAIEISNDETNHVKALRAALGDAAVAMPELNLDTSFTAAAQAAGIINSTQTFSPYADDGSFLLGAFLFEDTGVTAYNGAAPLISSKAYLAAAASILAVEAYHAASVRSTLFSLGQDTFALIDGANKAAIAIGAVDSGKSQGIEVGGVANIVPTDENSLAFARTPGQVIDIVYLTGTAGTKSGGFFPNGLNGVLNTAAGAGN